MNILNKLTLMIIVMLVFMLFSSCDSKITEDYGNKYTDVIDEIRNTVPFDIIIPRYFPEEIRSIRPNTTRYPEGISSRKSYAIGIMYMVPENYHYILIIEENSLINVHPNEVLKYTYLEIAGIRVLEQENADYLLSDNIRNAPVFIFDWNTNETIHNALYNCA